MLVKHSRLTSQTGEAWREAELDHLDDGHAQQVLVDAAVEVQHVEHLLCGCLEGCVRRVPFLPRKRARVSGERERYIYRERELVPRKRERESAQREREGDSESVQRERMCAVCPSYHPTQRNIINGYSLFLCLSSTSQEGSLTTGILHPNVRYPPRGCLEGLARRVLPPAMDRQPSERDQIACFGALVRTGDRRNLATCGANEGN